MPVSGLFASLFPRDGDRLAARRGAVWVADRVDDVRRRERVALLLAGDDRLGCSHSRSSRSRSAPLRRSRGGTRSTVGTTSSVRSCSSRTSRSKRSHLEQYGDAELAGHIDRAIAHFAAVAPLHFEHAGFDIAMGLLLRATSEWGIDASDVAALLAGASPATSADRGAPRRDRARPRVRPDVARRRPRTESQRSRRAVCPSTAGG